MKRNRIKRFLLLVSLLLLLMGCQLSAEKKSVRGDIQEVLHEGAQWNDFIQKKEALKLPEEVRTALMPTVQNSQGRSVPVIEKRFDLYAEQVPARTFFLSLVEGTSYNITVHPHVEGRISLQLKKVSIPEVLETVRNVYGYDFRQTRQGVEVLPASLQTRSFSVNYLDLNRGGKSETQVSAGTLKTAAASGGGDTSSSSGSGTTTTSAGGGGSSGTQAVNSKVTTTTNTNFWDELKASVETIIGKGEGRHVAVSPLASLIVVQAMPDELKEVEEFLKNAELSLSRQVILEAKILEVELNDSYQAGINWGLVNGRLRLTQFGGNTVANGFDISNQFPVLTSGQVTTPINVTPGQSPANASSNVGNFGGVFALAMNARNLGTFIEVLGAQGKVHVLSSPRVSTINNQKALIKVGQDQFFITNISTTTTTSSATTQNTPNVTFDSFFSGVALDVTPHISDSGDVTLHIHPTISQVEDDIKNFTLNGQSQSFPLAKSSVRESDNMVKARNGEMVIIGGLMQNQTSDLREGVPVLKDLPLLGNLFRHNVQKTKKSELVILLRPIVVDNSTWARKLKEADCDFKRVELEVIRDENKLPLDDVCDNICQDPGG